MKAIKATYENGKVTMAESPPNIGPVNVLVIFPDDGDDPWAGIDAEETVRPSFAEFARKCLAEIAMGKSKRLDLDEL